MIKFEDFIEKNEVKRISKDIAFAKALWKRAEERVKIILKLPLDEETAFTIFEQIYESLREYADALLAIEGFKSYSHLASILYLNKYPEILPAEVNKINNAREKRNNSKYYAKKILLKDTQDLILFYNQIKPKLDSIFKKRAA